MTRILHTSDLHFSGRSSEEREYSIFVWSRILELAREKSVDAILLAGDVFDRFSDLEQFRKDFLDCIPKESPPIYAITGNHEYIGKGERDSFSSYSLSPVQWFYEPEFFRIDRETWELVVIPYSPSTPRYREWKIPTKSMKPRILMAHGILPEALIYTGPSSEEGDHILELDLIQRFEPDIVALGHIHKSIKLENLPFPVFYCGSPRIWRRGEEGVRSVNLFHLDPSLGFQIETIPIREVGINREIVLQVSPSGEIPTKQLADFLDSNHCPKDSIFVTLMGFVDSEDSVRKNLEKIKNQFQSRYRKLELDTKKLNYLTGISELPIVKNFLKRWEDAYNSAKSDDERSILEESRQIGLEMISRQYRAIRGD